MIGINVLRALQDYRILEFFAGYRQCPYRILEFFCRLPAVPMTALGLITDFSLIILCIYFILSNLRLRNRFFSNYSLRRDTSSTLFYFVLTYFYFAFILSYQI